MGENEAQETEKSVVLKGGGGGGSGNGKNENPEKTIQS